MVDAPVAAVAPIVREALAAWPCCWPGRWVMSSSDKMEKSGKTRRVTHPVTTRPGAGAADSPASRVVRHRW